MRQGVGPTAPIGDVLMVGCGSIGQAVLPLLVRDLRVPPERITVVTADGRGQRDRAGAGRPFVVAPLSPDELPRGAGAALRPGDFLLNLSVGVASLELLGSLRSAARSTWIPGSSPGRAATPTRAQPAERSNQAFRARALALRGRARARHTHGRDLPGSQPRTVSQLMKASGLELARAVG